MFSILAAAAPGAAENVTALSIPGAPEWLNWTLVVVFPIITLFLSKWMHGKSKETKAALRDASLSSKQRIEMRLKDFALERAAVFVERDLIQIAQELLTKPREGLIHATRQELKKLGEKLAVEAMAYFSAQDVDIVKELGDEKIRQVIEWAADKVSPFPGKPTAKTMVDGGAKLLVDKGTEWVKQHVRTNGAI